MTETGYFLTGLLLCTVVILGIIAIVHRKLFLLLTDLCKRESRAFFWTYAIEVWFFLYSISSALRWCPDGTSDRVLFFTTIKQIKDGLSGTSTALMMFSAGLLAFVLIRTFTATEKSDLSKEEIHG